MSLALAERRPPWVVFTGRDDRWAAAGISAPRARGGEVFRLDGRQLFDPAAVFTAFARELSFPGCFGHNWDALVDTGSDSPPW
ncbi:MAG: barstar family protein [Streptomyces sp.]|nr:barstar family protein [Streptomyces sp.]NUS10052.1 barstar family protein [Streptomyces sp.]NUS27693.1 barstar family protein [Streptomyces sp.]